MWAKRVAMQPNFIRVTEMKELWPVPEGMKGFENLCKTVPSIISCESVLQLSCALHAFVHLLWNSSLLVQFHVLWSYSGRIRDQWFPVKLCQSYSWLSAFWPELPLVIYYFSYESCSTIWSSLESSSEPTHILLDGFWDGKNNIQGAANDAPP